MPVVPPMPVNDLLVLGFIASMFILFMVVLGAVAWWSNQSVRPEVARATAPQPAPRAVAHTDFTSGAHA